jgi:heat shock protein HslJ
MNSANLPASLVLALCVAATAGCGGDRDADPVPRETQAAPEATPAGPTASAETASGLAGSAWRLVKISSMDDTVHTSPDSAAYTLEFVTDGSVRIQADCNRGTGSWTSDAPGQVQFGQIAATMAICPPGSLHDIYMAQFQWVRSYVIENGHLFLATMADGSIIEFQPAPPPG